MATTITTQRKLLLSRRIRWFVAATISYNVIEAAVALTEGARVSSSARLTTRRQIESVAVIRQGGLWALSTVQSGRLAPPKVCKVGVMRSSLPPTQASA